MSAIALTLTGCQGDNLVQMRIDCNNTTFILHAYDIKEVYVNPNVESSESSGEEA